MTDKPTNPPILSEAELDAIPPGKAIWSLSGDEAEAYYNKRIRDRTDCRGGAYISVAKIEHRNTVRYGWKWAIEFSEKLFGIRNCLPIFLYESENEMGADLMDLLVNCKTLATRSSQPEDHFPNLIGERQYEFTECGRSKAELLSDCDRVIHERSVEAIQKGLRTAGNDSTNPLASLMEPRNLRDGKVIGDKIDWDKAIGSSVGVEEKEEAKRERKLVDSHNALGKKLRNAVIRAAMEIKPLCYSEPANVKLNEAVALLRLQCEHQETIVDYLIKKNRVRSLAGFKK